MWRSGIQFKVYQDILAGKIKLPNLPDNTMKLRHTLANPNFRIKDLLPPLHANPEVASVIMQAANSTAFYGTRPSGDLNSAVVRLGTSSVTSLVLTHSLESTFIKRSIPAKHAIRALWQQNLRIGALCSAIARRISEYGVRVDADQALLAGSMYHVGTLMLLSYLNTNKLPELSEDELSDIPLQVSANIGVVLAKHWKLEESLVNCIRHRDQFEELTPGPFNLLDVFQLATLIHRIHDQNDLSLPALEKTTPVKKAALHGILGESLDHFVTLVDAQASLLLNTITGQNQNGHQLMSAASRYELKSPHSSQATVTNISAAKRYCA